MLDVKENQKYKVKNAVIMAAGLSSRFAPLSYEYPKALLKVKGEVLLERQIRQLQGAGIHDITIVVGYKKELFNYLGEKFQVRIIENPEYNTRNNNSSLYYVRDILDNTYICSADNYFTDNVFESVVEHSYYAATYDKGQTTEWCLRTNEEGLITHVEIGGEDSWVMMGHVFFTKQFSSKFVEILEEIYDKAETAPLLWEAIYANHIEQLPMYVRKYPNDAIFEFDTLDELREFDEAYNNETGSKILGQICKELNCKEIDIKEASPINQNGETIGFKFTMKDQNYQYDYKAKQLTKGE